MNFNTKKLLVLLTTLTLFVSLLAGCGAKKEEEPSVGLPNPLAEVSQEEMTSATGISLDAPAGAEDVHYFTLQTPDSTTAQVVFTYDGVPCTYRAQLTGELEAYDMSGLYYDNWTVTEGEVSYCPATVLTNDVSAAVYWLDIVPGINYTLAADQAISADDILEIANAAFVPAQGDVDGDGLSLSPIAEGSYEDDNFDTVTITGTDTDTYDVEIGIYRLASFEGQGYIAEGCLIFTAEDPSGGEITGRFFPNEDGSYSLIFTDSKWSLLESGSLFEGFFPTGAASLSLDAAADYSGHYLDGQDDAVCDSLYLTMTEPATYDVKFDVIRLAGFEGTGHIEDGMLNITFTDPNGNEMKAQLTAVGEEVYNLTIVDSTWSLLETGTVFEYFVPVID